MHQLNMFDRVEERVCSPVTWTNEDKRMIRMSVELTQYSIASSKGSEWQEQSSHYAHADAAEFIRDHLVYAIVDGLGHFAGCSHSSMTRNRGHAAWLKTDDGRCVYTFDQETVDRFNGLADEAAARLTYLTGLVERVKSCAIADLPLDIPAIAKAAQECRARAFTLIDPVWNLPTMDGSATERLVEMFPSASGVAK